MRNVTIILSITLVLILTLFSIKSFAQDNAYSYAYVSVEGKLFSKKLKVTVDFGDSPEQLKKGKEFSKILTDKKSYAAILNYMVDKKFELVEVIDFLYTHDGTGGTSGLAFIMRKETIIANIDGSKKFAKQK